MAIRSVCCPDSLEFDLSVRQLDLKTTGYQHILASVMEADPSVNHALLSAVDQ